MPRKRANTPTKGNKIEVPMAPKFKPLMQMEAQYFQELVEVSNRYTTLRQQKETMEFAIGQLEKKRNRIQSGKIKMPILLPFIPKHSWYMENEKKEVLKFLDEEIGKLKSSVKSLNGQLAQRYDEYHESAIRNREFLNRRYKKGQVKEIVPARKEIEGEETLFEAEFKELVENEEKKEEFKKAKAEAMKKNVARKTKKA